MSEETEHQVGPVFVDEFSRAGGVTTWVTSVETDQDPIRIRAVEVPIGTRGPLDTIHLTRDSAGLWSWRRRDAQGCLTSEGSPQVDKGLCLADLRGRNGFAGYVLVIGREG